MRPGMRTINVLMFDRIIVNVVEMAIAIVFISDGVFPEPSLPNAARSLAKAGTGSRLFRTAVGEI